MRIKRLPAGFVIPAQPVMASKPPSGPDWVHEIKHDGYRMMVRRDGPTVRLYSRNAYDWTARLPAIAAAAERIEAKTRTAVLYAFDLIEHDGEDLRDRPLLDRKAALARLLRNTEAGILLNEHLAEDGPAVLSKKVDGTHLPGLDQGPESRQRRSAAGAQRELE
jgi:bifunctional non-homologous end joining protein LigD